MGHTVTETKGEFEGWDHWPDDPFESKLVGPFYYKREDDGSMVGAFRAAERHMNGGGFMHGGCTMTFADFAIFAIATDELTDQHSVTMTMSTEFLGPAHVGDLMEARGEVTQAGRSVIFVRGMITANGKPCLSFSATIKKIRKR